MNIFQTYYIRTVIMDMSALQHVNLITGFFVLVLEHWEKQLLPTLYFDSQFVHATDS